MPLFAELKMFQALLKLKSRAEKGKTQGGVFSSPSYLTITHLFTGMFHEQPFDKI